MEEENKALFQECHCSCNYKPSIYKTIKQKLKLAEADNALLNARASSKILKAAWQNTWKAKETSFSSEILKFQYLQMCWEVDLAQI